MSDCSFTKRGLNIHGSGVAYKHCCLLVTRLVPHETVAISAHALRTPYSRTLVQSHIRRVHTCVFSYNRRSPLLFHLRHSAIASLFCSALPSHTHTSPPASLHSVTLVFSITPPPAPSLPPFRYLGVQLLLRPPAETGFHGNWCCPRCLVRSAHWPLTLSRSLAKAA